MQTWEGEHFTVSDNGMLDHFLSVEISCKECLLEAIYAPVTN